MIKNDLKRIQEFNLKFSEIPYKLHKRDVPQAVYQLIAENHGHFYKNKPKPSFDAESLPTHLLYQGVIKNTDIKKDKDKDKDTKTKQEDKRPPPGNCNLM